MNKDIVNAWGKHQEEVKQWIASIEDQGEIEYEMLLKNTIRIMFEDGGDWSGMPDFKHITQIDYGEYQGTFVFIMGGRTYQPNVNEHWYTYVSYGSCSGCDTLESVRCYKGGRPTTEQVTEYWTLCLHMIQRMKRLGESED